MLLAGVLPLLLAAQGNIEATSQATTPVPVPEPTMMIVEFPRGVRVIGLPARCPGSTATTVEELAEEICFAELYEGRATVVRHFSGPLAGRNERLRLTAHARSLPAGTRMLVLTQPFEDQGTTGNFAVWWHLPEDDDEYCMEIQSLAQWGDNPVTRIFAEGYRRRLRAAGYGERADFLCVRE